MELKEWRIYFKIRDEDSIGESQPFQEQTSSVELDGDRTYKPSTCKICW
jgi:hypothetical protein